MERTPTPPPCANPNAADEYEDWKAAGYPKEAASKCPFCGNIYTEKDIEDGNVVPCPTSYKCFVGDCGNFACECEECNKNDVSETFAKVMYSIRVCQVPKQYGGRCINDK